jgi:hypothetical protein
MRQRPTKPRVPSRVGHVESRRGPTQPKWPGTGWGGRQIPLFFCQLCNPNRHNNCLRLDQRHIGNNDGIDLGLEDRGLKMLFGIYLKSIPINLLFISFETVKISF